MAWTRTSAGSGLILEETYTLPASATTEYSSELSVDLHNFGPNLANNNRYVSIYLNASAVTGTNLDIALYGAMTEGGTKFLLKDAIVADITATGANIAVEDLNALPAPYYYIAWTSDVNESANTIDVKIYVKK